MPEMPHPGQDHRHAVLIGGADDFLIAHAAARLNDCCGARFGDDIQPIAEGKEGIAGRDRAFSAL